MDTDRLVTLAPAVAAGALLFALAAGTRADSDLWGHLRFGLDMLATRSLPTIDPYSFTQDLPWINHEWLSELAMAVSWSLGGPPGLTLLKGLVVAVALWLVWRRLSATDLGARTVVFAFIAVATAPLTRTFRPQVWTLLLLVVLCSVLTDPDRRRPWWLPAIFAAWANLHGGWIVGIGVLGAWTVGEAIASRRIDWRAWSIAVGCVCATLITPYGWQLWAFLASTVRMERAITEWQPLWNSPAIDTVPWLVTTGGLIWLLRRASAWPAVLTLVMLAYASARVIRILPLFVAAAGVIAAQALSAQWPAPARRRLFDPSPAEPVAAAVITAVLVALVGWVGNASLGCISIDSARAPERRVVDLLREAPDGRLVTYFDWGEYAIWHLGPRVRVSMDGRRETVYSDARLAEHAAILDGHAAGLETLSDWQPEYVWLPAASQATLHWLTGRGYRLEHSSSRSFLAVRPDISLPSGAPAALPAAGCFPG